MSYNLNALSFVRYPDDRLDDRNLSTFCCLFDNKQPVLPVTVKIPAFLFAMYKSTGTIKYDTLQGYRLVIEVDQELADYYRALIPKWKPVQRSRWRAHITVVRPEKEIPPILEPWGKYEGEPLTFFYAPGVHEGKVYYWLNIWCVKLEEIRRELGLPVISEYTLPPEGFTKCFHCTIANKKL